MNKDYELKKLRRRGEDTPTEHTYVPKQPFRIGKPKVKIAPAPRPDAKRYLPSEKTRVIIRADGTTIEKPVRGGKIRGPATHCPYCSNDFFSRAARAKHIQLAHRNRKPVLTVVAENA